MEIIEVIGMPGAGKTTVINNVVLGLEKIGKSVEVVPDRERADSIAFGNEHVLAYNIAFTSRAVEAIIEYSDLRHRPDYLIIERGVYDYWVWLWVHTLFSYDIAKKDILIEAMKTFHSFRKFIDTVVYFDVSPEVAIQRHFLSGRHTKKIDDVVFAGESKFLQHLRTLYRSDFETKVPESRKCFLDAELSLEEVSDSFWEECFDFSRDNEQEVVFGNFSF